MDIRYNRWRRTLNKFIKFCLRTLFTLFKCRCKIRFDLKNLPQKGVYVSNHVSYLDPLFLYAFLPGNPVFALNGHLHRRHWIRNLMKYADTVLFNPIEPTDLKELIAKVDSGRLVVIFAEGRITENGGLMKIYEAPGLLADKSKAPIIPVWIDGPQYGYFSKTKGKLPHRPLPKVRITVGEPRPFKLKDELRRQRDHISNEVYMILREMQFEINYNPKLSLFAQLMKTGKVHAKEGFTLKRPKVIEDINRKPHSYKDLLVKSFVLGKALKKITYHFEHVGLMLPNTLAAVCAFFAAIGRNFFFVCKAGFFFKKAFAYTAVYVIPRKDLVKAAPALIIKLRVNSARIKRLHPAVVVKIFIPSVKFAAVFVRRQKHLAESAVAAGKHAL